MAEQTRRPSITEKNLQRWKMIQIVSLLPLLVSIALMFFFKGSMVGIVVFFLILIVGVILPQISRNVIESHLILLEEIRELRREFLEKKASGK